MPRVRRTQTIDYFELVILIGESWGNGTNIEEPSFSSSFSYDIVSELSLAIIIVTLTLFGALKSASQDTFLLSYQNCLAKYQH